MKMRSLEEVQKRGHWKAQSSFRNYEKAGRLHKIVAAVPAALMRYGEECHLAFAAADPQYSWRVARTL